MKLSPSELDAFMFNCLYFWTGLKKEAKSSILSNYNILGG